VRAAERAETTRGVADTASELLDLIYSPTPRAPALNTDRPDHELSFIELQHDAVVVVSLRVDDFAQIQMHLA
jgi:hypothetical protein